MTPPLHAETIDLKALIQQDEQAFKALVKSYHNQLVALANTIVGSSIAEEVVQEAWLAIYQNLPAFEQRASLKTWLFRITSNQAISRLRREKRYIAFSNIKHSNDDKEVDVFDASGHWAKPLFQWQMAQPDEELFSQELHNCIQHVLSQLPPLQQSIFLLRDIEGESSDEVCNNLQISASNMRVLLHRARFKLYQHINHYQESGEC